MRYGVFSDVHSNLEALDAVIDAYKNEAIDRYLCVGDIVGYAANPNECLDKVKTMAAVTIAGNHDWASVDLFSLDYFNPVAKEAVIWTEQNIGDNSRYFLAALKPVYQNPDLTLVHGTLNAPQEFNYLSDGYAAAETFNLLETKLCFVGHTHRPEVFIKDREGRMYYSRDNFIELQEANKYIVNVGSVGQPRDGNPDAIYCVYDSDKKEIHLKRVNYDIETARRKILAAGLPQFLGDRLLAGR